MAGDPRFLTVLDKIKEMHVRKNADYGSKDDPYANVRAGEQWGVQPWVSAMIRANDKIKRLQKYAKDGILENESAEDSFLDLASYAIIAYLLHGEQK